MGIPTPNNAGMDNATPGSWQKVSQKTVDEPAQSIDEKLNIGIRKRKFEDQEEAEDAGETAVRRGWGSTTKTYPGSTPMHDDLDSLLAASVFKTKKNLKQPAEEDTKEMISSVTESEAGVEDAKNNTKVGLLPPVEQVPAVTPTSTMLEPPGIEDKTQILHSPELEAAVPVFKKRRPKK